MPKPRESTQQTVVPRQNSENKSPVGTARKSGCAFTSSSSAWMKSVALPMSLRADWRMLGILEARKAADMLSSELHTVEEFRQWSIAILRFMFALESKPDHAGQTCSNQLTMKADEVSVMQLVNW